MKLLGGTKAVSKIQFVKTTIVLVYWNSIALIVCF